ncbi:MAG TPA: segregation/condensation protein A [Humisphaera sp.]
MEHASREYRVELDVYNGPLDLLLYLIRRDELDIYDIPITRILDSYMQYVEMLKDFGSKSGLDINVAGDFLVMAATLMEVKSAMLLPKAKPEEGKEGRSAAQDLADPRYELVQQLLEYKRFKDTAVLLERKQEEHRDRFARYPARRDGEADEPPPVDLDEVQVWDLLSAFSKLMAEIGQRKPKVHEVAYDETPIELHAADIEDRLNREGKLSLRQLIVGRAGKSEIIGVFLALLELIRQKKILVTQGDDLSDLQIDPAPEEHRRTYEHASLALSEGAAKTRDEGTVDAGTADAGIGDAETSDDPVSRADAAGAGSVPGADSDPDPVEASERSDAQHQSR